MRTIFFLGMIGIGMVFSLFSQESFESAEDGGRTDGDREFSTKNVVVWKGKITGVYQDRRSLKIQIYRDNRLPNSERERKVLREEILSKSWDVYQEGTNTVLGKLEPRELIWKRIAPRPDIRGEEWTAILIGEGIPTRQKLFSWIKSGSFIAKYKQEYTYLEPHNFYGKKSKSLPTRIIHPKDGKEMLLVDRGVFLYGQGLDSTESSFHPEFFRPNLGNLIEIQPFYMDKYEVTNKEYMRYLRESNSKPPGHWYQGKYPEGEGDHPVDFLTYEEAQGYAGWSGKRLPTEWEWEKASRGAGVEIYQNQDETLAYDMQTIPYPFGERFDPSLCNTVESKLGKTQNVYELAKSGASPYGMIGMCGNVAEWTSSWFSSYPGQPFSQKGYGKFYRVIRGGSYREDRDMARVFHRSYGGIPNLKEDRRAGIRLVRDVR